MRTILLLTIAACFASFNARAGIRQADSVTNHAYRGAWGHTVGTSPGPTAPIVLLNGVPLETKRYSVGTLTSFGPFHNLSAASLNVSLIRTENGGPGGMAGWVDGVLLDENLYKIEIAVPPGGKFSFATINKANLSVVAHGAVATIDQIDISARMDFEDPVGAYKGCHHIHHHESGEIIDTLYIYEPGSLSDRSHTEISWINLEHTIGPKPKTHAECAL